jgi:hypothetical protein
VSWTGWKADLEEVPTLRTEDSTSKGWVIARESVICLTVWATAVRACWMDLMNVVVVWANVFSMRLWEVLLVAVQTLLIWDVIGRGWECILDAVHCLMD